MDKGQLLDGKALAQTINEELAVEVNKITEAGSRAPHLAAILVGDDGASKTYVAGKVKACEAIGFKSTLINLDADAGQEKLTESIRALNDDDAVDGFIVQLPLPEQIDVEQVTKAIKPHKDVDGFHPENIGRMTQGLSSYLPATPQGILTLLERNQVPTEGKHCVILGRSNIVGRPMSILMAQKTKPGNCTVTVCHSRTPEVGEHARRADILIAAMGQPGFVTADMVKEGAVVIDVGISRVEDKSAKRGYRLKGDVDFDQVAPKCSFITPVPGGVGPMTVASLLMNTLKAARGDVYPR